MARIDPRKIRLQPLRIESGWTVRWNHFYKVEPRTLPKSSRVWVHFSEDMLLLENAALGVLIDLGWYRTTYRVVAVQMFDKRAKNKAIRAWDNPMRSMTTTSTAKAAAVVDEWIENYAACRPPLHPREPVALAPAR